MTETVATAAPALAGTSNTLVTQGFRGTWADFQMPDRGPVSAILADGHRAAAAAVWGHVCEPGGAVETLVAGAGRVDAALAEELREDGFWLVRDGGAGSVEPPMVPRAATPGRVWLLTSGTTGRPKRVAHTLAGLTTVREPQPPRRWLCPYAPGSYAWWQVVTLSLAHPGQDVVFVEPGELAGWPDLALAEGVTAVSGTPTFWRQALLTAGPTLARLPLRQVTLGGEPVDQGVLDRLRDAFPAARVSWIYASSEAGASIAVQDGRAGFPHGWVDRQVPGRPRLRIDGDELLVESPHGADGQRGLLRTGDRVEVRDGRVLITGRLASDEINVGGSKVSAGAVREVLLLHPSVGWARVQGRRAPLVGSVVVADIVASVASAAPDGSEGLEGSEGSRSGLAVTLAAELQRWCASRLPDYAVPRRIRVLGEIPLTQTLKSDV